MNGQIRDRARHVGPASVAMLVAAAVVAACSSGSASIAPAPSAPVGGAVIVAQDQHYDRARLDLPAGVAVPLLFENRDRALHNVAIVDASGTSVFEGEIFGGAGARTYVVPALAEGTYSFRCDVHPDMRGTLVAGTATAGSSTPGLIRPGGPPAMRLGGSTARQGPRRTRGSRS